MPGVSSKASKNNHTARRLASVLVISLVLMAVAARADPVIKSQSEPTQMQEIPQVHRQTGHHSSHRKVLRSQVVEIPQRFLGCWSGAVSAAQLTKLELLSPPRIDIWLTKNYRVCFARDGTELKVTIADSSVDHHGQVLRATSNLEPISASGNQVELGGWLTLIERTSSMPDNPYSPPAVVLEQVKLWGELRQDSAMAVRAQVIGYYNGRLWWIGHWNCNFERQP
jgi:hypothetical protein